MVSIDGHLARMVGIDISSKCLSFGRSKFDDITFVNATAEHLPFHDKTFDLIFSRVSLPYTHIPRTLTEVNRVLKKNGRVWFTLHSFSMAYHHLLLSVKKLDLKNIVYRTYVIHNGIIFRVFGKQFPFLWKRRYESLQTEASMKKAMKEAGFKNILITKEGQHLICQARKDTDKQGGHRKTENASVNS